MSGIFGYQCDACGKRAAFKDGKPPEGWRIMATSSVDPEQGRATLCSLLCWTIWGEFRRQQLEVFDAALRHGR